MIPGNQTVLRVLGYAMVLMGVLLAIATVCFAIAAAWAPTHALQGRHGRPAFILALTAIATGGGGAGLLVNADPS